MTRLFSTFVMGFLVYFCVLNREDVVIQLWPFPIQAEISLAYVLLAAVFLGALFGYLWAVLSRGRREV